MIFKKKTKKINIYFTWVELPTYGYYLLKFFNSKIKKYKFINLRILSNRNPFQKVYKENDKFYKNIIWIKKNKKYSWKDLGLEVPDIFFQAGWAVKSFNYLGELVKAKNKNNKVIVLVDNSVQKKNIKQLLGAYYFKYFFKKKFDYAMVPGFSGVCLMMKFGFKKSEIFKGLYNPIRDVYKNNILPIKRKKQFIYVGQFIKRKNVIRLINAFKNATFNNKNYKLLLVGSGPLKIEKLKLQSNIKIVGSLLPKKLSNLYNESLYFILPSVREHWGVVVHEASLSGCHLLLSNNIGSIYEFANKKNSIIFQPKSTSSIQKSIEKAMFLTNKQLLKSNKESERLGKLYNYDFSYKNFSKIINKCLKEKII